MKLNEITICKSELHDPPSVFVKCKVYKHVCPLCNKITIIRPIKIYN